MDLKIALGPLLFNWAADDVLDFYRRMARENLVSRVYLGEVVCGKREPLLLAAFRRAADLLQDAGKAVVWSTLALPATARDRRTLRELVERRERVEVNDISALALLPPGRAFIGGPLLNIYNGAAARILADRGCEGLCANVELALPAIGEIRRSCPGLEIEVFAFGRIPLALSARCHHAHRLGLSKDTCRFVCDQSPDGLAVETLEGTPFLSINGVQTLSHGVQAVDVPAARLLAAGVRTLRLSPHACDMSAVIAAYGRYAETGEVAGLHARLRECGLPGPLVGGYLRGTAGMAPAGA